MSFPVFRVTIRNMSDLEPEPHDPQVSVSGAGRLTLKPFTARQSEEEPDDTDDSHRDQGNQRHHQP